MRAKNHWKPWTAAEERRLVTLVERDILIEAIAVELGRSLTAIRDKCRILGVAVPRDGHHKPNEVGVTPRTRAAAWTMYRAPQPSRYGALPMRARRIPASSRK